MFWRRNFLICALVTITANVRWEERMAHDLDRSDSWGWGNGSHPEFKLSKSSTLRYQEFILYIFKLSALSLLYRCFRIVVLNTLESNWTARRSNQSSLKEINPEFSLDGLMLKLQYFGHLMRKANSLEKPLMLGKIEGKRRRRQQRVRRLDSITDSVDMNLSKLWEIVEDWGACSAAVHGVAKSRIQLSNWTTTYLK